MLGQIPSCFVRVPLKRQRHRLGSSCRRIRTCSSEDSVRECRTSQFILQSQKSIFFKAQPSTTRSTVALGKADQPSTRDHLFLTDRAQLEVFGSGERSPRRPGECVLAFANFGGRGGCSVGCPQPIFLPDPLRQRTLQPPQFSDRISNSRSRRRLVRKVVAPSFKRSALFSLARGFPWADKFSSHAQNDRCQFCSSITVCTFSG